jgi:hypothetical protein
VSTSKRHLLAVLAGVAAGTLLIVSYQAWQRRPSAPHDFHDWGSVSGSGVLNGVRRIGQFDSERGRFSYYTGARSGDLGALTAAPTRVVAEAAHGAVSVRLLAFDGYEHPDAAGDALELARIVSHATTDVFPAATTPVELDVHFMPEGARFSLAKRVDWREGRPYALAVFAREGELVRATPAHELYHVLGTRWSLRAAPEATRRPGAASSYEEAAAELYAACGELLANAALSPSEPSKDRVTITDPTRGDRVLEGALSGEEIADALDLLRSGANGAGFPGFGPLVAATVFEQVFGGETSITPDSPQGARLLDLCRRAAADPFTIEAWLVDLERTVGASRPEAPRTD